MRWIVYCLATCALIACTETVSVETNGPEERAAFTMQSLVAASPTYSKIPRQCPLATYGQNPRVSMKLAECRANPAACLAACDAGDAGACFSAARVIETGRIGHRSESTYPLFMASCALGVANGCVNAGATVKNGQWSGTRPARAATPQCQFQTYDRMCKDGAPWGCYMIGQEYLRTDGFRPRNEAQYEASMRRACQLGPETGACLDNFR